jgi:hypothetical protein
MTSRKHYIAVAREIAELLKDMEGSDAVIAAVSLRLACIFEKDNPAFDRERFLRACGIRA